MPMSTKLSPAETAIIILNFQGKEDTVACLHAIREMPDQARRVIVVDNCSQDDSLEFIYNHMIKHGILQITEGSTPESWNTAKYFLLSLSRNYGYAGGNNAGIRLAFSDPACRAVWILNSDTLPQPGSLIALCDCINRSPSLGMAGSTLVYMHDPSLLQCAAGFSFNTFLGTTKPLCGEKTRSSIVTLDLGKVEESLDYISGASLLVKREVIEIIGYLAEEYFLYYEDTEFGIRARKYGYRLGWAPESIVHHKEGGSTGASATSAGKAFFRSERIDYLSVRNRMYLMRTHFPYMLPSACVGFAGVIVRRMSRRQYSRIPWLCRAFVHGITKQMEMPLMNLPEDPHKASKLNILFISARADFGGGPEHLWQLIKNSPLNAVVYVACPKDYPYYNKFCSLIGNKNVITLQHRSFTIKFLCKLYKFCYSKNIHILHSHGKGAGVYGRILSLLTGKACFHTFHGIHTGEYGFFLRKLYYFYERCMSILTKKGISVSEEEYKYIIAEGLMPPQKLCVIQNGVDIPEKEIVYPDSPPYRVVSISRFNYQKNTLFLLDVLQELKRINRLEIFNFVLIGDGPDKEIFASHLRAAHLEKFVYFAGTSLSPQDFFSESLCYFSSSRWEGLPLAVLEAMSHGLPPVVSAVIGNQSAVSHEQTGLLYPEGNAAQAAEVLCKLVDKPELKKDLGLRARAYVLQEHNIQEKAMITWDLLSSFYS